MSADGEVNQTIHWSEARSIVEGEVTSITEAFNVSWWWNQPNNSLLVESQIWWFTWFGHGSNLARLWNRKTNRNRQIYFRPEIGTRNSFRRHQFITSCASYCYRRRQSRSIMPRSRVKSVMNENGYESSNQDCSKHPSATLRSDVVLTLD